MQIYTIFTVIILAILFLLSAALFMRKKLFSVMSVGLKVLYALGIIGVVTALLLPQIYTWTSDKLLQASGVHDRIVELDEQFVFLNIVKDSVGNVDDITDRLSDFLNNLRDSDSDDDASSQEDEATESESEGYFTENLYPIFVDILAGFLRLIALIMSMVLVVLVVYVSYGMSGATDAARLEAKVASLEAKLSKLEDELESKV
ncbi:MAG: hypothetical protein QY318_00830 [Candidatus Dojkabacteria bacterium]|nr:MAG: hypothetical protein QY318_00830 [Candidatus Dojkabacteria bacterium]